MDDDHALLERLRAGDEAAFQTLVDRHDGALRRVARTFVNSAAAADEVVTFGFFDGTLEQLEASQGGDYEELRKATDPLVDEVVANGIYEIVEDRSMEGSASS